MFGLAVDRLKAWHAVSGHALWRGPQQLRRLKEALLGETGWYLFDGLHVFPPIPVGFVEKASLGQVADCTGTSHSMFGYCTPLLLFGCPSSRRLAAQHF